MIDLLARLEGLLIDERIQRLFEVPGLCPKEELGVESVLKYLTNSQVDILQDLDKYLLEEMIPKITTPWGAVLYRVTLEKLGAE